MDYSPPGSAVRGIFQARKLEWVAISYSRGYLRPRDRNCICVSCIGRQILYHWGTWENLLSYKRLDFQYAHLGGQGLISVPPHFCISVPTPLRWQTLDLGNPETGCFPHPLKVPGGSWVQVGLLRMQEGAWAHSILLAHKALPRLCSPPQSCSISGVHRTPLPPTGLQGPNCLTPHLPFVTWTFAASSWLILENWVRTPFSGPHQHLCISHRPLTLLPSPGCWQALFFLLKQFPKSIPVSAIPLRS